MYLLLLALPLLTLSIRKQDMNKNARAYSLTNPNLYGMASVLTGLSSTDLTNKLNDYQTLGVRWARTDFAWPWIQPTSATSYSWSQFDTVVNAANARGIKILGILDYTPQWELPSGCTDTNHCPPKSNADYANFAATVVARYAPMGVHYWEIWNEPNGGTFSPAAYTAMLQAAYPAIKQADPTAVVLAGGSEPATTGGGSYQSVDFLTGMYQNGAKGYFDALTHHPYCYSPTFNCPTAYATWSGWSQMQDTSPSLRSVMTANGDGNKQIWATEFGAPTGGGSVAVSETQQAQMVHDAYNLFASYSWAGPLFWYTYWDFCTDTTNKECFFGLLRNDYSHKPAYATYQSLATAATNPTATPTLTPTPTSTSCSGLSISVPTSLDKTTVVQGQTINGSVTYKNNCATSFTVNVIDLASRDSANNNKDFSPTIGTTTVSPGQTVTLNASRTILSTDLTGTWTAFASYQDASGIWHPDANVLSFTVVAPTPTPTPTPTPLDTTPPTVTVTSPKNGTTVRTGATITITATDSDNVGVTKVNFLVNGTLLCSINNPSSPTKCNWVVPGINNVTYTITAQAYDAAGNASSSSVQVTAVKRKNISVSG